MWGVLAGVLLVFPVLLTDAAAPVWSGSGLAAPRPPLPGEPGGPKTWQRDGP